MRPLAPRIPFSLAVCVATLSLRLAVPAAAQDSGPTPEEAAVFEELSERLEKLANTERFSGTVLIARGDEVLFEVAHGLASRRYGVYNEISTRFHMGSMNKMFTGIAICQLVEQGLLAFDDPIIKHLPDYPNQEIAAKVTVHHLLTHTSGIAGYFGEGYAAAMASLESISDYLPLFVDKPLDFEPGARFGYSNGGPVVLGLIIEALSGQGYFEYVDEHVLKPAGMTESGHWFLHDPQPDLAMGYTKTGMSGERFDTWRENTYIVGPMASPAGGAYTNVRDMHRFARALESEAMLSQEMFEIMTKGRNELRPGMMYGYLYSRTNRGGVQSVGHNGGGPGVSCDFAYFPESQYTMVVLTNIDGGGRAIGEFIKSKLYELSGAKSTR